jgi:Holliday junction resolvasome RuvABC endonuclease subunit
MSSIRVFSLDISASSTGWSYYNLRYNNTKFGTIKTTNKDTTSVRLTYFRATLLKLLKKYKPTIVLIEDTFVGRNPAVVKLLAKFGGVAEQVVYEFIGAAPIIVSNKTVKAFFCTKKKEDLFEVIHDLLGWTDKESFKTHNDVADSIAQYIYYIHTEGYKIIKEEKEYGFLYK